MCWHNGCIHNLMHCLSHRVQWGGHHVVQTQVGIGIQCILSSAWMPATQGHGQCSRTCRGVSDSSLHRRSRIPRGHTSKKHLCCFFFFLFSNANLWKNDICFPHSTSPRRKRKRTYLRKYNQQRWSRRVVLAPDTMKRIKKFSHEEGVSPISAAITLLLDRCYFH